MRHDTTHPNGAPLSDAINVLERAWSTLLDNSDEGRHVASLMLINHRECGASDDELLELLEATLTILKEAA